MNETRISNRIPQIETASKYADQLFLCFLDAGNVKYARVDKNALNWKTQRAILDSEWAEYLRTLSISTEPTTVRLPGNVRMASRMGVEFQ